MNSIDNIDEKDITWLAPHYSGIELSNSVITEFSASYDLGDISYIKDPDITHIIENALQTYFYNFFMTEFKYGTIFAAQQAVNEFIYEYVNDDRVQLEDEDTFYNDLNIGGIDTIVKELGQTGISIKVENIVCALDFKIKNNPRLSAYIEKELSSLYKREEDKLNDQDKQYQFFNDAADKYDFPLLKTPLCYDFLEGTDIHDRQSYRNEFIKIIGKNYLNTDDERKHIDTDCLDYFQTITEERQNIFNYVKPLCYDIDDFAFNDGKTEFNYRSPSTMDKLEKERNNSRLFSLFKAAYTDICPFFVKNLPYIFKEYTVGVKNSTDRNVLDFLSRYSDKFIAAAGKYFNQECLFSYMLLIFSLQPKISYSIWMLLVNSMRIFPNTLDKDSIINSINGKSDLFLDNTVRNQLLDKILVTELDNNEQISLYDKCNLSQKQLEAMSLSKYDAFSHYMEQAHNYEMNFATPYEDAFYCNYRKYDYCISGRYNLNEIQHSYIDNGPYTDIMPGPDDRIIRPIDFSCKVKAAFPAFKDRLEDIIRTVQDKYEILMKSMGNGPYVRKIIGLLRDANCREVDGTGQDQLFQISCCAMHNTCPDMPYIVSCDGYLSCTDPEQILKQTVTSAAYMALCADLSGYFGNQANLSCNSISVKCDPDPAEIPDLSVLAQMAYGKLDRLVQNERLVTYNQNDMFTKPAKFLSDEVLDNRYIYYLSCGYPCQDTSNYYGCSGLDIYLKSNMAEQISKSITSKKDIYVLIIDENTWSGQYQKMNYACKFSYKDIWAFKSMLNFLYKYTSTKVIYDEITNGSRFDIIQAMRDISKKSNVILFISSHGNNKKGSNLSSESFITVESDGMSSIQDSEIYDIFQNTDNVIMYCYTCFSGGLYYKNDESDKMKPTTDQIRQNTATKKLKNFLIMCADSPCSMAYSGYNHKYKVISSLWYYFMLFVTKKNTTYTQLCSRFNEYIIQLRSEIASLICDLADNIFQYGTNHPGSVGDYVMNILNQDISNGVLKDIKSGNFYSIATNKQYTYNTIDGQQLSCLAIDDQRIVSENMPATRDNAYKIVLLDCANPSKKQVYTGYTYIMDYIQNMYQTISSAVSVDDINLHRTEDECIDDIINKMQSLFPQTSFFDELSHMDISAKKSMFTNESVFNSQSRYLPILTDGTLAKIVFNSTIRMMYRIVETFMFYLTDGNNDKSIDILKYNKIIKEVYQQINSQTTDGSMGNEEITNKKIFKDLFGINIEDNIFLLFHDLPQIVQCRGNSRFMDQPFLRFVV